MTIISTTIKSHANPREVILYPVVGQNDFQDDIFTNMFAYGYTTVYEYNEDNYHSERIVNKRMIKYTCNNIWYPTKTLISLY